MGSQASQPGEKKSAIHLARLRLDGFASVRADEKPGTLVTNPMAVDGSRLFVNADARAGELRVGILAAETGDAITGFSTEESVPIIGDGVEITPRWKGQNDIGTLRGQRVRVSFDIKNADVYALWFENR